jgi:iron complex outermembrane receptor protein
LGNPDFQAENLVAYEIGYRAAPADFFSWDIAGYFNVYDKLQTVGPFGPPEPPFVTFPAMFENGTRANTYGFETTANYQCSEHWRLFGSYSLWELSGESINPTAVPVLAGSSPHNQIYLKSSWDLGSKIQFDLIGRYVDALTALDVPSYFELDTRLGWQLTKTLEISFVGQNLCNEHHLEFVDTVAGLVPTQERRSWYGMLTWKY